MPRGGTAVGLGVTLGVRPVELGAIPGEGSAVSPSFTVGLLCCGFGGVGLLVVDCWVVVLSAVSIAFSLRR